MRPLQTFFFLLALGAVSVAFMFVVPTDGLQLAGLHIKYPTWEEFSSKDTLTKVDMDAILRASHMAELDSLNRQAEKEKEQKEKEEQRRREEERIRRMLEARKLQFSADSEGLMRFASALQSGAGTGKVRVLHYGDSQIEGDRISSVLRDRLQKRFGGYGPGMVDAVPQAPSMSIKQKSSDDWKRYTRFGRVDTSIGHDRYGMRAVFAQNEAVLDSAADQKDSLSWAWLEFKPSRLGFLRTHKFSSMLLYAAANDVDVPYELHVDDSLMHSGVFTVSEGMIRKEWIFPEQPGVIRMRIASDRSLSVYGVSFEGQIGLVLDNIPMRGASGLVFTKLEEEHTQKMLADEAVGLVLLQYGGNTVPYIKDRKRAESYARRLRSQLRLMRSWMPAASFVLIGPSDMSQKKGTSFETYESVLWVRDALKEMALEEGIGFWDLFGAMGGYNSMPAWVANDPALAGPDHIHFTPKGARQVGEWLADAFEEELDKLMPR